MPEKHVLGGEGGRGGVPIVAVWTVEPRHIDVVGKVIKFCVALSYLSPSLLSTWVAMTSHTQNFMTFAIFEGNLC